MRGGAGRSVLSPDAPALKVIMEEAGWTDVRFYRLGRGMVAVHVGTKAETEARQK